MCDCVTPPSLAANSPRLTKCFAPQCQKSLLIPSQSSSCATRTCSQVFLKHIKCWTASKRVSTIISKPNEQFSRAFSSCQMMSYWTSWQRHVTLNESYLICPSVSKAYVMYVTSALLFPTLYAYIFESSCFGLIVPFACAGAIRQRGKDRRHAQRGGRKGMFSIIYN
jgi:hypothetical protein